MNAKDRFLKIGRLLLCLSTNESHKVLIPMIRYDLGGAITFNDGKQEMEYWLRPYFYMQIWNWIFGVEYLMTVIPTSLKEKVKD